MGRPLDEDIIIKILERWQKAFKENSHYVSASDLSLVIKDVRELPTIQSVATDTNVGDKISKFIDGLEEIFADLRERHVDDSVCGLCEYDGAYMGQSGDWCNECPGFEKDDCFKLSDKTRKKWTDEIIKALPTVQPERTEERTETHAVRLDAISRQAAIDALDKRFDNIPMEQTAEILMLRKDLRELPPAQPERAEGEWIVHLYKVGVSRYECDTCHARCDIMYPYCPYCGEKKEGERYAIN